MCTCNVQGGPADFCFIIRSGQCEVLQQSYARRRGSVADGKAVTRHLGSRWAGDLLGEAALLTEGELRTATVRAVEEVEVLALAQAEFLSSCNLSLVTCHL